MAREIRELKAQVQTLLSKSQPAAATPTTNIDIAGIIAQTTEAVMQRMLAQQQQIESTTTTNAPEASSDANATGGVLNMSVYSNGED